MGDDLPPKIIHFACASVHEKTGHAGRFAMI
jgi:hypothetical protein